MNQTDRTRIVSFFAVAALFSMASSFAHPVTPVLFKQLALEDYMFGVAVASMAFGNLLFSPFWGRMTARLSSRTVMLICCAGYGLGQLLFASAQNMLQVIFIRFGTGIFVGGVFVGMLTYVVRIAPDEHIRAHLLVVQATVEAASIAIGYFVGGMLGEISVRTSVVTQACTLSACGVLFFIACRSDRQQEQKLPRGRAFFKEINPLNAFLQGKPMLSCTMGLILACGSLQYFSQTCFDQSFNYYVIDQLKLSTGYNGVIKGSMGLVTLLANSTLCLWMMKHIGAKKAVAALFLLCAVAMTAALSTNVLIPFLVLSILFYAFNASSVPMLRNLTAADGRQRNMDSGMVMSFYNALKNLGGILGALVAGFTYMVSPKTPFVCCIASMLIAAVTSFVYHRRTGRAGA